METDKVKFDQWCIVEIMGHQKLAGRVTEHTIAGAALLRVDVPATNGRLKFTKYVAPASLYALPPVSEEVARSVAEELGIEPISVWDLDETLREKMRRPALAAPTKKAAPDYGDDDFDDAENPEQLLDGPF
jgi:hypothetical protein